MVSARGLVSDCSNLKKALLTAKEVDGFLCLPDSEVFPVSLTEHSNPIPSKLLIRSFHGEVKLILQNVRNRRKRWGNNGGAIFFGPSGTGKSWTSQAVLVDELREAEVSGKTVVFFDAAGRNAFVFSKTRNVLISGITSLNVTDIPEVMERRDTVVIYDAVGGPHDQPTCYPCEYIIFSSPNGGNLKNVAGNHSLLRFICPNWTVEELQLLEHGYGGRDSAEEIKDRFERVGGFPRYVVTFNRCISEYQESDARLLLKGVVPIWSNLESTSDIWPTYLLKARYNTEVTAVTPEEALNKYLENNVIWEYSNTRAKELVHAIYDKADEVTRRRFQMWLGFDDASALYDDWFEHTTRSLFQGVNDEDVEIKVLEENEGLSRDDQVKLTRVMRKASRHLTWTLPAIKEIHDATMVKKDNQYDLAELKKLTNPAVLYRLPDGFPLINYFNPPNNCFALGVGGHHIRVDQAVDLCSVVPAQHQVNFVYVTPSNNYRQVKRWLNFDTGNGGGAKTLGQLPTDTVRALSRMVQFCMKFKKC